MSGLAVAWFVVVAVFVAAYAILDGFDLGIGILYAMVGRDGEHREALHDTISPVWDGNEVWLILIGGLVFAVFPPVYASVLSGFYLVFMLILFGLILRAGALGLYYARVPTSLRWVLAFSGGSIVAACFLGLVAGNLIRGVPLDANGDFAGGIGHLFNPFAIVIAILALAMFANQGAAWAALKTVGEAHALSRTIRWWTGWLVLALFAVVTLVAVFVVSDHARTLTSRPLGWVMIAVVLAGILCEQLFGGLGRDRPAFFGASAVVAGLVGIWAVGAFPVIVPASNDPTMSLTVTTAAAPHNSLVVVAVVAAIGIPLAAVCLFVVYRTFRGRRAESGEGYASPYGRVQMNAGRNDIGMIGLGTMGSNLVLNMADKGFTVAVFNRTTAVTEKFASGLLPTQHVQPCYSLEELLASVKPPRRIMMMVDAGKAVDAVLAGLDPLLQAGDIVIDGGNSYFKDTERRAAALDARGIGYLGVGISGGESGARYGPSMMPGGPHEVYDAVRPVFEAVAAKADGAPCVAYLGPRSAGHYVKMVHNGIEYGLMQLIAESYALLKQGLGLDNERLAAVYAEWQAGELESYLLEITAAIFGRRDDKTPGFLVDLILGEAGQLGTGMWTSQSAMDLHVPVPNIDIAVSMRNLSALDDERAAARQVLEGGAAGIYGAVVAGAEPAPPPGADGAAAGTQTVEGRAPGLTVDTVREALFAGVIITYVQGFAQLQHASTAQGYELALHDVASIWRGGCIIRSALLRDIKAAFERQPHLPNLLLDPELSRELTTRRAALAAAAAAGMTAMIPVPGILTALAYLDGYLADWLPTNLIQAQRDYFGAHTYRRIDQEGIFHTDWSS